MPIARTGDEAIFYALHRRDAAHPLILIHGAGGTHLQWGYQLAGVERADSYAVDLPGHGRSSGAGRASIGEYAANVIAFMDAVGLDRAVIAGSSMGGAIAQVLALDFPARVAGLILVGTGARLRVAPALLDTLRTDFRTGVETLVNLFYSADAPAELRDRALEQWLQNEPDVLIGDFVACDRFDVTSRLGQIVCPARVICGTEDRLTPPKYSAYLRDHIPAAELALIEGAGHMVMIEQADAVTREIDAFLFGPGK